MPFDEGNPRLGYRASVSSRAKDVVLKTIAVLAGAVALISAFVLSLAFFAIALAVVLVVGGYLWWKTRALRQQWRAQMQDRKPPQHSEGDVIEGVVISRTPVDHDKREPR